MKIELKNQQKTTDKIIDEWAIKNYGCYIAKGTVFIADLKERLSSLLVLQKAGKTDLEKQEELRNMKVGDCVVYRDGLFLYLGDAYFDFHNKMNIDLKSFNGKEIDRIIKSGNLTLVEK